MHMQLSLLRRSASTARFGVRCDQMHENVLALVADVTVTKTVKAGSFGSISRTVMPVTNLYGHGCTLHKKL